MNANVAEACLNSGDAASRRLEDAPAVLTLISILIQVFKSGAPGLYKETDFRFGFALFKSITPLWADVMKLPR